jgi:hypothetical protein
MKNKLLKSQKGAISLYVMLSMLFFLMFMLGAYTIVSRKNQSQVKATTQLRSLYAVTDTELTNKYKSKFADADEVIPISNTTEITIIGTGNSFEKNGKIYKCDSTKSYQITNDIIIDRTIIPNTDTTYKDLINNGTLMIDLAGHTITW